MENLKEVIEQEKQERAAIKENLKNFHTAVNARETEIYAELDKRQKKRMADLEEQAALLQDLISEK